MFVLKLSSVQITFVFKKALIQTFYTSFLLQNILGEFTTRELLFKRGYCTQNVYTMTISNMNRNLITSSNIGVKNHT